MRAVLTAVLVAAAVVLPAAPAVACGGSEPCDTINRICHCLPGRR